MDNNESRYKMTPIPLLNVRPFYLVEDIQLATVEELDIRDPNARSHVKEYLMERVRAARASGCAPGLTLSRASCAGGAIA